MHSSVPVLYSIPTSNPYCNPYSNPYSIPYSIPYGFLVSLVATLRLLCSASGSTQAFEGLPLRRFSVFPQAYKVTFKVTTRDTTVDGQNPALL